MLDESMLAKDRRRESYLLAIMSTILLVELWVFPYLAGGVLEIVALVSLVIGLCASSVVVAWSLVRCYRLCYKRSTLFIVGLLFWLSAFVAAVVAQFCPIPIVWFGVEVSWIAVFLVACMCVSAIVKISGFGFAHEIGWPLLKPVHWLYSLIVVGLYVFGLLSQSQVFLYVSFSLFLISRYAYNRWIYATRVIYPYKPTAAKFYIKQLR